MGGILNKGVEVYKEIKNGGRDRYSKERYGVAEFNGLMKLLEWTYEMEGSKERLMNWKKNK